MQEGDDFTINVELKNYSAATALRQVSYRLAYSQLESLSKLHMLQYQRESILSLLFRSYLLVTSACPLF